MRLPASQERPGLIARRHLHVVHEPPDLFKLLALDAKRVAQGFVVTSNGMALPARMEFTEGPGVFNNQSGRKRGCRSTTAWNRRRWQPLPARKELARGRGMPTHLRDGRSTTAWCPRPAVSFEQLRKLINEARRGHSKSTMHEQLQYLDQQAG